MTVPKVWAVGGTGFVTLVGSGVGGAPNKSGCSVVSTPPAGGAGCKSKLACLAFKTVSYTHLTLPTNREV